MIRPGEMVRSNFGAPMKLVQIEDGIGECLLIDGEGVVRRRFVSVTSLNTVRESLRPKSLWPEISHVDLLAIEEEERIARNAKRAERSKTKKSLRLKRKGAK